MTLDDNQVFSYHGESVPYSQVTHVGWKGTRVTNTAFLVPINSYAEAKLSIFLETRHSPIEIEVVKPPHGSSRSTIEMCQALYEKYILVSERTFHIRLSRYLEELAGRQYFTYSVYHFYETGEVVMSVGNRRFTNLKQSKVFLGDDPSILFVQDKSDGFVRAVKAKLQAWGIPFEVDRDVFQFLLMKLYNVNLEDDSRNSLINMAIDSTRSRITPQSKKCPYCAEIIKAEAIKCRYCGSNLTK